MARRPEKRELEMLSEENLRELRHNLAHLISALLRQFHRTSYGYVLVGNCGMARELVWLENGPLSAWGCKACGWLVLGPAPNPTGTAPVKVKDSFDAHDCAKFSRILPPRKKPPRSDKAN